MNTISCVFGVTLVTSCQGTCRTWSWVCVLDQRERGMESAPSPHTRAQSPISPSLTDQPRRLRPNRHHMPAEEGGGSMEISWEIFHSCNTGIPHCWDFYNANWNPKRLFELDATGCVFWVGLSLFFLKRGKLAGYFSQRRLLDSILALQ